MTYALLGLVTVLIASNITSAIWLHGATKDRDAMSDDSIEWRLKFEHDHHFLEIAENNATVLTAELDKTKKQLADTQQAYNSLALEAHDHFVRRLQESSGPDAAKALADLLAGVGPLSVLPKTKRSDDPKDGLIDPSQG